MPLKERDVQKILSELGITSWRLCERIRVRELVSTHRLERMHRLRMLEGQEAWKREADFARIKVLAEMHAQRLHVSFDSQPLYTGLYKPSMATYSRGVQA